MNRNQNERFAYNPTNIDIQRSRFKRSSDLKTSFNAGDLIPIYLDEVLPGDTIQMKTSKLVRMSTLAAPIMDNIYLDTYYFFVPHRLVWDHWQALNGQNDNSPWVDSNVYTVPQVGLQSNHYFPVGSIADYMGVPTNVSGISVSALPFRSFAKIWNDWFRDENLQTPQIVYVDDTDRTHSGESSVYMSSFGVGSCVLGLHLPPVAKYHDYFTSCLPSPQKGPDVTLPLGTNAWVYAGDVNNTFDNIKKSTTDGNVHGIRFLDDSGNMLSNGQTAYFGVGTGANALRAAATSEDPTGNSLMVPINLYTDLTNATAASIISSGLLFSSRRCMKRTLAVEQDTLR